MPKKWTTDEQGEFFNSHMAEFRLCTAEKKYEEFFKKVNKLFFERWPERKALFGDLLNDESLTPDQAEVLKNVLEVRKKQIATWYRWQTNPAHLGRTSGVKGVLKFDAVLSGGVELKGTRAPQKVDIYSHKYYEAKVKGMADTEIQRENMTNRGPKLNKRCEVTRRMFLEESEEVKEKIERKYRKARSRYMKARQHQKSGKLSKIDEAAKIKAIRELGPMLDRIFKYLAYATGGWKFSVLMGGNDPSTGEVSVFNYHLGELESGAQFDQQYSNFDVMQGAFLAFVKDALAFEATLPQDSHSDSESEEDDDTSSESLDDDLDGEWTESSAGVDGEQEDLILNGARSGSRLNTAGLYRMTPQSESSAEIEVGAALTSSDALLGALHVNASGPQASDSTSLDYDLSDATLATDLQSPHSHSTSLDSNLDDADPAAFDHNAFNAMMNDPNFILNALETFPGLIAPPLGSQALPVHNEPDAGCRVPPVRYPEVLLPPVPHADLGDTGPATNEEVQTQPANKTRRRTRHLAAYGPSSPTSETQSATVPLRRARKPFNPRERDNDIGAPAKRPRRA
ncbi:uncharacterized protein HD556DRAFT_1447179 [Suillus plorans]|uniref:Uncharacterized protein n=1 Tax=Suillus plorans TaxID=116603 RepID=A0A9P7AGZ1_9AGAM|nr:uncharacterized protein HD556DRAFT_1447179 [Suillus plorans]KAG1789116.1 hypothetical protein HD556DRAFT_1447179 [Suillus plorans]